MERVLVMGGPGAGKSTAAVRVATALGVPLYHLDMLFWQPGWREPRREEFEGRLARVLAEPAWVVDGNYSWTLPQRLAAADAVLWLDFPTSTCLRGVLARWVRFRGRQRPDMAPQCPEKVDRAFLWYVVRWRARHVRPLGRQLAEAASRGVGVHRVRGREELERWLGQVALAAIPGGARHGA